MQPILKINLTTGKTAHFTPPADWIRDYLGGASLGARLLYEHLTPALDPLSPDAPLLFLTGPLTGTGGPSVGRFVVCGRSPATGLWAESNCGGFWGPELRRAGFFGLWITGRAESPVSLWVEDGALEIRDAAHLWGLETASTQDAIRNPINGKKPRVLTIGPAGESQIPFALILTDHGRVAGRTGLGAVMGAKNLKAIAVRGSEQVPVADAAGFASLRLNANRALRDDNLTAVLRELGSAGGADYFDYLGEMPKRYFQSGVFEGAAQVTGSAMAESILTGVSACHACVIACGRVVQLPGETKKRKGPEYETMMGFGPNLLIDDLSAITRLGERCDQLGMDTISLSGTIGLAFTLFERGAITETDTGGLHLTWGDPDLVMQLVEMTARREGFGEVLADGARALGRKFGFEQAAIQVNGLEVAYHDPRGASGMVLTYATSPRGACHNQSDYFMADILGQVEPDLGLQIFDRHAGAEKAANVVIHQNWRTALNALVMCFFANVPPQTVSELVAAATGEHCTPETLLRSGERAWNLKRLINRRLGLTQADDTLPEALLRPYDDGGSAGYQIPFAEMLAAYYAARGWDADTGMPAQATLAALGLEGDAL